MRTSKREAETNYLKNYADTDTLAMVKLEPTDDLLERAYTGSEEMPIDIDNRAIPAIDINQPIPAIPINSSSRILLSQRPRKERKDARGQDSHTRKYENWLRWYEKGNNKQKHNTAASKRSTTTLAYAQRYCRELNTGMMLIENVKGATVVKYGLEYKDGLWITTLTTDEMRCIDDCKDKKDDCACDDTESVASLTEAEVNALIREASNKVLKVADKPTKAKKKVVEKVIEQVVETTTNKRVRKAPQRFKANNKK
jgi:hypothetical protein